MSKFPGHGGGGGEEGWVAIYWEIEKNSRKKVCRPDRRSLTSGRLIPSEEGIFILFKPMPSTIFYWPCNQVLGVINLYGAL